MKKLNYKKIICTLLCLFLMGNVLAADNVTGPFDSGLINSTDTNVTSIPTKISTPLSRITGTIILVFQLVSLGGIVTTGVRYMRLGAEGKAQMKKALIYIMIGCVIVFAGSTVVQFLVDSFNEAV